MTTTDEARNLLERCIEMLEEMRGIALGKIDPEEGKIVWPIKEGDYPSPNDAYATLYSLSDASLELSFYDDTGNEFTDTLSMTFMNIYGSDGPAYFARRSLKEMLQEELQIYIDENNTNCRPARLLARLIKAFDEEG